MAQFAVHRNPNPRTRHAVPYLLDVQTNLLDALATRVVVPLVRTESGRIPAERLNPVFRIEGIDVLMSTAELAGVSRNAIGEEVMSLQSQRAEVVAALDFLLTGV